MRTAVVIGSTGLVGHHLVEKLAQEGTWDNVLAIARHPATWKYPKIRTIPFDFENWGDLEMQLKSFSGNQTVDFFCCLGSTIKKAGSQEAFRKVDFEAVVNFAKLAKNCKAEQLLVISALGADAQSSVFYNKVKGEMEQSVKTYYFGKTYFARPSLLLGDRKDFRLIERLAILASPLFSGFLVGSLSKYRPIKATRVAEALVLVASKKKSAQEFIENSELLQLTK